MFEKTITYEDFNGEKRTESHFFNLNQAEVVKWLAAPGEYTIDKVLLKIQKEGNMKKSMDIFDDLLRRSYGRISEDGRRFEKNDEIWENFHQTEAYSQIFMELIGSAKAAAEFVNGILPKNMSNEITKIISEHPDGIPAELKDYVKEVIPSGNPA